MWYDFVEERTATYEELFCDEIEIEEHNRAGFDVYSYLSERYVEDPTVEKAYDFINYVDKQESNY